MAEASFSPALIDRIYEAAVATELWPQLLEDIGTSVSGLGSVFIARSPTGTDWICAPSLEEHMAAYADAGWATDTEHTKPLFVDTHAGFRAETAYRTVAEIEALPVKRDFMIPRGLIAAAASVFQGSANDALYLTVEGFRSHSSAERAVARLDLLRPHIGRSLSLSAKIRQARVESVVAGLEIAGAGAAVVACDGRLRAANSAFENVLGNLVVERRGALAFTSSFLQSALAASLRRPIGGLSAVASVAVQVEGHATPIAVHFIPLLGRARDICSSDGVLVLTARPGNELLPNPDLLRLLFDLTASEARIARLVTEGMTIAEVARTTKTSELTIRTHLRSVFSKTGVRRQAELVRLLSSIRTPVLP